MYLNCLLTIVGFSMTFCRKYYLLETEEKENHQRTANGVTSTTPASNKEFSNMARDAVIRSHGRFFSFFSLGRCESKNNLHYFFSRKVK